MPLYEYQCECGSGESKILPISQFDQPQICECGEVMEHKMSLSSFAMKQTGNEMALATLNAPKGKGMPDRHWKPGAERKAFAGVGRKPRAVW